MPSSLCNELEQMMARFWWGQKKEGKIIYWISWKRMCEPKSKGGMGFKDLKIFNDALLAKQAWRLVHIEDSMFYKVYKPKYFPNSRFLDSNKGHNSSYAWQGIWSIKDKLSHGCKWRIGNGRSIEIWNDYWIPCFKELRSFVNENVIEDAGAKVFSLIDSQTRWWDVSKVRSLLPPIAADASLKMVLSSEQHEDSLIWTMERKGNYSMKSAYRLFTTMKRGEDQAESSNTNSQNKLWKFIWSLSIPNNVKVFKWRACVEGLPTMVNLKQRRSVEEDVCRLCLKESENTLHALYQCDQQVVCWKRHFPCLQATDSQLLFGKFLRLNQEGKTKADLEMMLLIAWNCWYKRNQWIYEEKQLNLDWVITQALSMQEFCNSVKTKHPNTVNKFTKWMPPPTDVVKLNVDGAVFHEARIAGVGVVLRDSKGEVLMACSKRELAVIDSYKIELIAVLRGLQLCIPLGLQELQIESDSLMVVKDIQDQTDSSTMMGHIVEIWW